MNNQNQWLFEVPPTVEATRSSFELSDGEWEVPAKSRTARLATQQQRKARLPASRGIQPSQQTPNSPSGTLTYADVRSDRIDVFAQKALLRMSKNPAMSADAAGMAAAVKSGKLGGIYKEDQKVPALWIKKINPKTWWVHIIPKGEDAVLFLDPDNPMAGIPIIVFRDSIRSIPQRLDPALLKAWKAFQQKQTGQLTQCTSALYSTSTQSKNLAFRYSGPSSTLLSNVVPPVLCQNNTGPAAPSDETECPPFDCSAKSRCNGASECSNKYKNLTFCTCEVEREVFNTGPGTVELVPGSSPKMLRFSTAAEGKVGVPSPAWRFRARISPGECSPKREQAKELTKWEYGFIQTIERLRWLAIYTGGPDRELVYDRSRDTLDESVRAPWYQDCEHWKANQKEGYTLTYAGPQPISTGKDVLLEDSPRADIEVYHPDNPKDNPKGNKLCHVFTRGEFSIWLIAKPIAEKPTKENIVFLYHIDLVFVREWILLNPDYPGLATNWAGVGLQTFRKGCGPGTKIPILMTPNNKPTMGNSTTKNDCNGSFISFSIPVEEKKSPKRRR